MAGMSRLDFVQLYTVARLNDCGIYPDWCKVVESTRRKIDAMPPPSPEEVQLVLVQLDQEGIRLHGMEASREKFLAHPAFKGFDLGEKK
ncbi:MAG: hypothetical protein JSR92_19800 [Proteobacteria bacterium]|nr:hypothetical protein [Pseudomonadota bacterium]